MAWYLSGAVSLPKQMLTYSKLGPSEQISVKFEYEYRYFPSNNVGISIYFLQTGSHFDQTSMC